MNQNETEPRQHSRALRSTEHRGRRVTEDEFARARSVGADDKAIHDTVLVAAAFCMYNRYVDGLDTWAPQDAAMYDQIGEKLVT